MDTWEKIALGAIIVVILIWRFPMILSMLEESKDKAKDWNGLIWPIGLVVLFIIFLISQV